MARNRGEDKPTPETQRDGQNFTDRDEGRSFVSRTRRETNMIRNHPWFDYPPAFEKRVRKVINKSNKFHQIYNIGNSKPIKLLSLIKKIENILGLKAKISFKPMQKGEVYKTFANIKKSEKFLKYENKTTFDAGLEFFINWYRNFNKKFSKRQKIK